MQITYQKCWLKNFYKELLDKQLNKANSSMYVSVNFLSGVYTNNISAMVKHSCNSMLDCCNMLNKESFQLEQAFSQAVSGVMNEILKSQNHQIHNIYESTTDSASSIQQIYEIKNLIPRINNTVRDSLVTGTCTEKWPKWKHLARNQYPSCSRYLPKTDQEEPECCRKQTQLERRCSTASMSTTHRSASWWSSSKQ